MYYRKPTTNYDEAGPERDEARARGARDDERRPMVVWPTFPSGRGPPFPGGRSPPAHYNAHYQQNVRSMGHNAGNLFVRSRNATYSWERQSEPQNRIDTYAANEYHMTQPQEYRQVERIHSDDDDEVPRRRNTPSPDEYPQPHQSGQISMTRRQKRRETARMHQRQNAMTMSNDAPVAHSSGKRPMAGGSHGGPPRKLKRLAEPSGEKVAVIPENFPVDKILMSHIGPIQEVVITRLLDAPDPIPKVTFGNIVGGILNVYCNDRHSITWLSSVIGEREISGLKLKVVETKDLPKPIKMAWKTRITGIQDSRVLLKLLKRLNPSLHTEEWKIVDTSTSEATTRRIILMDRMSADVIREAGYVLHTGIDISTFKLLEDTEREKGADDRSAVPESRDVPEDFESHQVFRDYSEDV